MRLPIAVDDLPYCCCLNLVFVIMRVCSLMHCDAKQVRRGEMLTSGENATESREDGYSD